jgi:hypothetical protein
VTFPHWLKQVHGSASPDVIVSFDTETKTTSRDGAEVLTLRCWDAIIRCRHAAAGPDETSRPFAGERAGDLADLLAAACSVTGEAWAFAHNAGFDLTVTSLPMVLVGRGWEPSFVNIGDETCVFILRSAHGKLTITDTWSWLRCPLGSAAKDVGMRKTRLPADADSLEAWHHRCKHDVSILDRLLSTLLDWWDSHQLGSFAATGAGCGWRTLRAKIPAKSVLVAPAAELAAFEREAIFGGRKEVWQVGRNRRQWVEDWDLAAAYLTTVANFPLPTVPVDELRALTLSDPLRPPEGLSAVCRVQIDTRVPCAPLRLLDAVWWPVGRFQTVLSSPELDVVVQLADRVQVLEARWYRVDMSLADWGRWCLGLQSRPDGEVPRVVKRVAKGWGRSVTGRFAMRTSELIAQAQATHLGWALETGHDLDTGAVLETITYGGVARTYRRDQEGADTSPAVLAHIEGHVRAAVARTIANRCASKLLQCNTDGWWEARHTLADTGPQAAVPAPYQAVRKAVSRDVTVIGPNHTDSPGDRRLSGIPQTAPRRMDGSYAWHDWPGLRWQLQFSRPGEYTRPGREMLLADHYCRRWVLTSGETVPVSTDVSAAGQARLLPWSQTALRQPGDELADHQVPQLAPLADRHEPRAGVASTAPAPLPGRR